MPSPSMSRQRRPFVTSELARCARRRLTVPDAEQGLVHDAHRDAARILYLARLP